MVLSAAILKPIFTLIRAALLLTPTVLSKPAPPIVDTSVLGVGERNGITPLGGLMAHMVVADRGHVLSKYKLEKIKDIEDLVAEAVQVNIPFNNYITGFCAFTHQAGIRAKAILAESKYLRDHRSVGLWHEEIRAFRLEADWVERHQVTCSAARYQNDGCPVQRVYVPPD